MKKSEEKKIYTIKIQNEKDTDFIINLLEQERIPYKVKPIKNKYVCGCFAPISTNDDNYYNIELHTDLNHYEYFTRLVCEEQGKYGLTIPISNMSMSVINVDKLNSQETKSSETNMNTVPSTPIPIPLTMLMMTSLPNLNNNNNNNNNNNCDKKQKDNKIVKKSILKKITDWIKGKHNV